MHPYGSEEEARHLQEEALARMVRDGVRPEGVGDRMKLAGDKLMGNVPMGVDARNPTMRKWIGGGFEFLAVVKYGLFGAMAVVIGGLFLWVGFYDGFHYESAGFGALFFALGVWMLKLAARAWRNVKTISKA